MPISTTEDYERALSLVRSVLSGWDPYALLEGGAPADEFDGQAAELVRRSRDFTSPEAAARAVADVFSGSFGPEEFPLESCTAVGEALFQALTDADLLRGGAA